MLCHEVGHLDDAVRSAAPVQDLRVGFDRPGLMIPVITQVTLDQKANRKAK